MTRKRVDHYAPGHRATSQDGIQLKRFVVNARLSYSGKALGAPPRDLKFPEPSKGGAKKRKGNRA